MRMYSLKKPAFHSTISMPLFMRHSEYIHFYVNRCGFHIVEFFSEKHPDPHAPEGGKGEDFDGIFRFEKVMKRV